MQGYTGQISFAHAAFSGVGAYASGMLAVNLGVRSMARGSDRHRSGALLGMGLGYLCIRMGGIYLSLTTLGFSEILRIIITNEDQVDPGNDGASGSRLLYGILEGQLLLSFLGVTVLFLILIYRIIHSEMGIDLQGGFK